MTNEREVIVERDEFSYWLAITALILSLISFSFVPLLIRWCEIELSPEATIFNRCWITTLILAIWQGFRIIICHFKTQQSVPERQQIPRNLLSQIPNKTQTYQIYLIWGVTITSFTINLVILCWALTQTSVANSSLMHNLTPMFTTLGSWLIFKTQFNRRFLIGVVIAVGGAIILSINDFQLDPHKIQGDILALISAVALATYLMVVERLRSQVSSLTILFWCSLAGTILTLIVTLTLGEKLFPVSSQGWFTVVALVIAGSLLGMGLMSYSLRTVSASLVALIFLLDPILTASAAWFAFGETLNFWNGVSFAIIIFGVYLGLKAKPDRTDN
ncbi:DMT family transporter [Okeania sp. KiyG1]|uniref:DMT family transporter n=1 Tax=Okeania sp. KiyG1 TaxID=2720165 RepID=UPI00192372F5|nr:EamA family transporter [Okeania sp. KiyG1]